MVAEIRHSVLSNGNHPPYCIFLIKIFEQLLRTGKLIFVIVQNFVKVNQTVVAISQFFHCEDSHHQPSCIIKLSYFWSLIGWED